MRQGQGQRAFGRLGSLVIAGVMVSAVVAAIAFAASNGSSGSQGSPPAGTGNPNAGAVQLQLGTGAAFPVNSFSWGISNPVSTTVGGGGGAGKASVSEMLFTKTTDATTVELLKKVATGTHYPTAVVTVTLPGTAGTFEYRLADVLVTNVSTSAGGGGSQDSFSLNFRTVTFTHTDAAGNSTPGSWDLASNTP